MAFDSYIEPTPEPRVGRRLVQTPTSTGSNKLRQREFTPLLATQPVNRNYSVMKSGRPGGLLYNNSTNGRPGGSAFGLDQYSLWESPSDGRSRGASANGNDTIKRRPYGPSRLNLVNGDESDLDSQTRTMPLREQERQIQRLQQDNFSLKMQLSQLEHYMDVESVERLLKENDQLKQELERRKADTGSAKPGNNDQGNRTLIMEDLQNQLDQSNAKLRDAMAGLEENSNSVTEAARLRQQMERLTEDNADLKEQLEDIQEENGRMSRELEELRDIGEQQQEQHREELEMWQQNRTTQLEMELRGKIEKEFEQQLEVQREKERQLEGEINRMRAQLDEISQQRQWQEGNQVEAHEKIKEYENAVSELHDSLEKRQAQMQEMQQEMTQVRMQLAEERQKNELLQQEGAKQSQSSAQHLQQQEQIQQQFRQQIQELQQRNYQLQNQVQQLKNQSSAGHTDKQQLQAQQQDNEQLRQMNQQLSERIQQLQSSTQNLERTNQNLSQNNVKLEEHNQQLHRTNEQLQLQTNQANQAKMQSERHNDILKMKIETAHEERDEIRRQLRELQRLEEMRRDSTGQLSFLKMQLQQANEQMELAKSAQQKLRSDFMLSQATCERLEKEAARYREQIQELSESANREGGRFDQEKKQMRQRFSDQEHEVEELKRQINYLQEQVQNLEGILRSHRGQDQNQSQQQSIIMDLQKEVGRKNQQLEELQMEKLRHEQEIALAKSEVAEGMHSRIQDLEAELARIRLNNVAPPPFPNMLATAETLKIELDSATRERNAMRAQLDILEQKLQEAEDDLAMSENQYEEAKRLNKNLEAQLRGVELRGTRNDASTSVMLEMTQNRARDLENQLRELQHQTDGIAQEKEDAEREIENLQKRLSASESKSQQLRDEIGVAQQELQQLKQGRTVTPRKAAIGQQRRQSHSTYDGEKSGISSSNRWDQIERVKLEMAEAAAKKYKYEKEALEAQMAKLAFENQRKPKADRRIQEPSSNDKKPDYERQFKIAVKVAWSYKIKADEVKRDLEFLKHWTDIQIASFRSFNVIELNIFRETGIFPKYRADPAGRPSMKAAALAVVAAIRIKKALRSRNARNKWCARINTN